MSKEYKWGILGPGKIAHRFTEGLKLLDNAVLHAVGSRDPERAKEFATQYGYRNYYGSYEEFVSDPDMDVVYVASPHSHHMEHSLMCLEAGKSVICEKAFALNSKEVEQMKALAASKGLFLMEALWPPFQPSYLKAHELLDRGDLGALVTLRSYFAFKPPYEPEKRLYNPELGGGALLDIGIYPVIDALTFLGLPDKIKAIASFARTGTDNNIDILFGYADGKSASLYASLKNNAGIGTELICESGVISIQRMSDGTQVTVLSKEGVEEEIFEYQPEAGGYQYEAMEVMRCMDKGLLESEKVPLSFSTSLINTLDRIREFAGIVYNDRE